MAYKIKYRLSQKSSLAAVTKAIRELGFTMKVRYNCYHIEWERQDYDTGRMIYECRDIRDEDLIEWINNKLEEAELLKPLDPEE